jgi:hypothetical protein
MARVAKQGTGADGAVGKTKAMGTFTVGDYGEKKPLAGVIHKSKDLRAEPSKNQGKMPSSMT